MSGIQYLRSTDIGGVLKKKRRHYLVGDFSQSFLIVDPSVEMGISAYDHYACESPHYHTTTTTYEYILEGSTKYFDATNNVEHMFVKGDVVVIRPNTTYAQKSLPETKIVFFKFPSGNDKIPVEIDASISEWFEDWENRISSDL